MNNTDITNYGKRLVQYFWDPLPRNTDSAPIWCLGRQYESHPVSNDTPKRPEAQKDKPVTDSKDGRTEEESFEQIEASESAERDESLANGWPAAFLDDMEAKIWMTYRSNFPPIARSPDPKASGALSFAMRLKNLANQEGFTTDSGFGCMIRSGQGLLVNTLALLELGRDWRRGDKTEAEAKLLSLFADDPSAPFSIHKFVEHGASACGKHPGEWFGPSATARCIQALTEAHPVSNLQVYVRPDDSDVYEDSFLKVAKADGSFKPTLILLGTRLGIDRITPVYWSSLMQSLEMSQSVGIAGGRPNRSHYFIGTQGTSFFYQDPHHTRTKLPLEPTGEDVATCHTSRLRRLDLTEMDPSMLLGFLIRSEEDWNEWKTAINTPPHEEQGGKKSKPIVHIHDREPSYNPAGQEGSGERAAAVEEVQSCDDSDDETVVS